MKLPVSLKSGATAVSVALAFGSLLAAPALGRDRKAPPPEVTGPAGDYPVQIGAPFVVDGVTYTPADTLNYDAVGHGVLLDPGQGAPRISGAHRTLPVPSYVEVTALDTGRTILVRLDQRGPMSGDGLVALSPMAWSQLGLPAWGSTPVRVRRVNPPEPERALLRTGQTAPLRMDTPPGLLAALRRKLGVEPPVGDLPVAVNPAELAGTRRAPAKPGKPLAPPKLTGVRTPAVQTKLAKPALAASASSDTPPAFKPTSTVAAPVYVQIGAFAQRANAEATARKSGGALVRVGNIWRVRSGPFSAGTEADRALAKARSAGYAGARIVRE